MWTWRDTHHYLVVDLNDFISSQDLYIDIRRILQTHRRWLSQQFFFFLDEGGSADCWSYQIRLQSSTRINLKVLKTLLSHWMIHNVAQRDANSTPAHLMTGGVFSVSASRAQSVCAHACDQASPHWHHGKNSISILQSHRSSSLDSGLIDSVALSFILQTPLMLSWSLLWHDEQKWGSHPVWIHY